MKIIKHGETEKIKKARGIKTFRCSCCGCCFEADKSEYSFKVEEGPFDYNFYSVYEVDCPDCKSSVSLIEE